MKCISKYMRYESTSFVSETRKSFSHCINNRVVTLQLIFFPVFCLLICGIHCPKLLWIYQECKWKKISQGLGCSCTQTGARHPRWDQLKYLSHPCSITIFLPQVPATVQCQRKCNFSLSHLQYLHFSVPHINWLKTGAGS